MAIPKEYPAPDMGRVKQHVEKLLVRPLNPNNNLSTEDYATLGKYLQIYNSIEWNARMAIKTDFDKKDYFIFLNMNHKDSAQIKCAPFEFNEGDFAIMDAADLRGLVQHMMDYEKWLAFSANDWFKKYIVSAGIEWQ